LLTGDAHEGEKRDREREVVGDDAEQLIGEIAEEVGTDETEFDADETEEQAGRRGMLPDSRSA
jgi:hypothetical protein